ncbi:MAG: hypothetical protein ACRDYF_14075 [Acidimicrobiia bacterium]
MRALLAVIVAWVICGLLLARLTGQRREGLRRLAIGGLLGPLTLFAATRARRGTH